MRKYLIDPNEWADVASDIGLGVHYWARALTAQEGQALIDLRLPEEYTVAFMALDPDTGQDDRLVLMRLVDYQLALSLLEDAVPHSNASRYVGSAWADRDRSSGFIETTYLDAEVHDAAVQVHVFGEVVYG
jgi:hypothetical protein